MIPIGSHPAWHPVFETAAYASAYAVYHFKKMHQADILPESQRWTIIAAAAVGALAGSRILGIAEQWPTVEVAWQTHRMFSLLFASGGKTIVGGLLGGWLAVELVKRISGIHRRTGDIFALPLCVGIAIGRIGCFLAGLADDTYGKPTSLPWAVDLGDGIGRHPVQIYEILFLILLAIVVSTKRPLPEGARFRVFLGGYLAWRLVEDFLKPQPLVYGLNLIQWSCLAGICFLVLDEFREKERRHETVRSHA